MALLGLVCQEKVGPLQASGSSQGGDQTQGSHKEQGRALRILRRAQAAASSEGDVPARAQADPPPRPPAWLPLPSAPASAASVARWGADCPGRSRAAGSRAQSTCSEGRIRPCREKRSLQRQEQRFPQHALPGACWSFVLTGLWRPGYLTSAPRPGLPRRDISRTSGSELNLPAVAWHPWRKNSNRKALESLPHRCCCSAVTPSLRVHHAKSREAGDSQTPQQAHSPQTHTRLIPVLSFEKGRCRGDGGYLQLGAAGAPVPPWCVPGWQLHHCLSTNVRNCWRHLRRTARKENKPALKRCQMNVAFRETCHLGHPSSVLEDVVWLASCR